MPRIPAPMYRARLRSLSLPGSALVVLPLALLAALSCSKVKDNEAFIPSQRGAFQPDAGGSVLGEKAACEALRDAESSARQALGCAAVIRTCPEFIRPAGSGDCFEYSQASVSACALLYESFTSCDEFTLHPCLLSAVSSCQVSGEGGASGEGGMAAASGEAGSPNLGTGGAAGASE